VNKDLYIRGFGEDAFVRMDIFPTFINHITMAASSTACGDAGKLTVAYHKSTFYITSHHITMAASSTACGDAGKLTGKQTGIFFICYSPIS